MEDNSNNIAHCAQRCYLAIDLKSFYASVECVERGLDPLLTNLVVADKSRTDKTICLAVSPSLKAYGICGRARLFEVVQRVREVNRERMQKAGQLVHVTSHDPDIQAHADWGVDYIVAPPRMQFYLDYSRRIRAIYESFVSPDDIHVYSVDEVFMDVTTYLPMYHETPEQLATRIVKRVMEQTGITATVGIGTNLYLCKIAMDIVAKHAKPDEHGLRMGRLDEQSYRELLWDHRPLTDFWRIGRGVAARLAAHGMDTMGMVARCSIINEDLLYNLFGVNAELIIDHAWGYEPVQIQHIKNYHTRCRSLSSGQVLSEPYTNDKARVVTMEMADNLAMELFRKHLESKQLVLTITYDSSNMDRPSVQRKYAGKTHRDHYGRMVPKHAHGTVHLDAKTNSSRLFMQAVADLFDRITDKDLTVRYINVVAADVTSENSRRGEVQLSLFTHDNLINHSLSTRTLVDPDKEKRLQRAMLNIRDKYGKNAALRGLNYEEGATARERNKQIGGHKA